MFNCFTVKKRNEKQSQEQPKILPTVSLMDSQIKEELYLSLSRSMGNQIQERVNNPYYIVALANSFSNGYPSSFKSSDDCSPQQSSATRPDKLATVSIKTWDEQSTADNDYAIPVVTSKKTQVNSISDHDYVNVVIVNSYSLPSKSNNALSLQKTAVARSDKPAGVSQKTRDNLTGSHDYVNSPSIPGDDYSFRSKSNGIHSPQKLSEIKETQLANDIKKLREELNQCSPSSQVTNFVLKHRLPTPSSTDGTQPLQKPNTATEIDKKNKQKISTMKEINNSEDLNKILQKRKERIDANDQDQGMAKSLQQQITAMDANRPVGAEPFNISTYHYSRIKFAVTVAGN